MLHSTPIFLLKSPRPTAPPTVPANLISHACLCDPGPCRSGTLPCCARGAVDRHRGGVGSAFWKMVRFSRPRGRFRCVRLGRYMMVYVCRMIVYDIYDGIYIYMYIWSTFQAHGCVLGVCLGFGSQVHFTDRGRLGRLGLVTRVGKISWISLGRRRLT